LEAEGYPYKEINLSGPPAWHGDPSTDVSFNIAKQAGKTASDVATVLCKKSEK